MLRSMFRGMFRVRGVRHESVAYAYVKTTWKWLAKCLLNVGVPCQAYFKKVSISWNGMEVFSNKRF